MATRISKPQNVPTRVPARHETTDVRAGWIFGIVLFLAVAGIAIHFMMGGMLNSLVRKSPPTDQWRPASRASRVPEPLAAFPRLQVSPPADLEAFRAREQAELHSYGWANKTSGLVRIPIEQAMELLLQKGLPVRRSTNDIKLGPSIYEMLQQRPLERQQQNQKEP